MSDEVFGLDEIENRNVEIDSGLFELPEEYLNRCEPINKDDLQKSFEDKDIEIADLKEEVNKIAFARGELETELNREKALNKVYEDNNRQLREMIEKMKCPWNCKKFSNCKLSICPCNKWEIKEK